MTRTPDPVEPPAPPPSVSAPFQAAELPRLSPEEARLFARHFEVFSETTNKLVAAHQHLQAQITILMVELENKNQQLEAVNRELAHKMEETDRVRDFLDRLIDSMQTGLVALDGERRVFRMNRMARALLGWQSGFPTRFEALLAPGSENPLPLDCSGRSRSGETRLRKRGGEAALVKYTSVPLAENPSRPKGEPGGVLFVFEDLSQLKLLEEKVRRSNRLAALGELAAGVAHEVRNPLATIRGFLQLLPTEFGDPDFREECSTRLIREIDRLARLTDELLELSRPIRPDPSRTALRTIMEEVLNEQTPFLQEAAISVSGAAEEAPPLPLDQERVKQVLLNLVINARQAMPQGGRLEWRLENCREAWGPNDEPTPSVRLAIIDTGSGIEDRHLESLFDPFFTTKDHGTGLGLAICHRIIEEHGGVIRVASALGRGTTFTLYFPVSGGT